MRTILAVLYVFLFLVLSIPVMLVEWIIGFFNKDLKDRSSFKIVRWAFRCVTFISGTKITVKGQENIPTDRAVLFIGNHRSIFDIVLVDTLMIRPTGFLAKKEIAKVPLLNVWIAFIHTLFLDRKDVKKGLQTILTAIDNVKKGISCFVFPEGTRNKTEEPLLEFHEGSFKIATKSKCEVVPVTLNGTRGVFEAQMPWIKKRHVIIEFGKPIATADMSKEEQRDLPKQVAAQIQETYLKNEIEL